MTLGCSVAMEHAVFKIRYNQDYSTKLFEISIVDKKYDFESYHVLNLIFKNFLRLTATLSTYFLNDPRIMKSLYYTVRMNLVTLTKNRCSYNA